MRTERQVVAELDAATAEHTAACELTQELANKRGALMRELKAIRANPPELVIADVEEPTDVELED